MTNKTVFFKITSITFLIWAIASTVGLSILLYKLCFYSEKGNKL